VRAIFQLMVLVALASPAGAQSLQVFGYAGLLGEWELTASVTEKESSATKEFSGPLTMSHVGICTVDGPEERTGEIRLRISEARMRATLLVDGVECHYRGRLSDFFSGAMSCPDRPEVPLKLWVK
jgi:hypothetical protein